MSFFVALRSLNYNILSLLSIDDIAIVHARAYVSGLEKGDDAGADCDNIDWTTEDELEIENFQPSSKSLNVPNGETIRDSTKGGDAVVDGDNFDWTTEDELELESIQPLSKCLTIPNGEIIRDFGEGSSYAGSSSSKVFDNFVCMGFPGEMVAKVIQEYGEDNEDKLLEELLTYSVLESSAQERQQVESDPSSLEYAGSSLDDFSDIDLFSDDEETKKTISGNDGTLMCLVKMGFKKEEALVALERLGPNSSLEDLVDLIGAAQMAKAEDDLLPPENKPQYNELDKHKKRRFYDYEVLRKKRPKVCQKKILLEDEEEALHLPNPMVGFGIPTDSYFISERKHPLSNDAIGPPYFYYENVAITPKGVWQKLSNILYGVEPEFVDSKYFCAAARKRGYIHNLPIVNRFPLLPLQPPTIHERFPLTKRWWPSWDPRTKLNCLLTCIASAKETERIRKALESHNGVGDPPERIQKYVLYQCRKWNLVWVGRNKVAPLEPDEVEKLLGFPNNHTRGISRTDRYKSLGNSFQVDTVAYHLSVLKDMYPNGINVLSLFSGIGGAEIALHQLGIPLRTVVSVEKSEVSRNVVKSWWEQSMQKGNLIEFDDVRQINEERLGQLMSAFGAFDLVIGGSPCNNLAGGNRVSRDGLEGKESSLFYDYYRILHLVKEMSPRYQ